MAETHPGWVTRPQIPSFTHSNHSNQPDAGFCSVAGRGHRTGAGKISEIHKKKRSGEEVKSARTGELPEHPVAQGGTQCCGSKVTDVSPVKALFSESDANHHLFIVYI